MLDNEFDNFVNGKLRDHAAAVPAGLWDKVTDTQFDNFFGDKLKDHNAPVPEGLWDKVTDGQFDSFFGDTFKDREAPVPADLWQRITDKQFDGFVGAKLIDHSAPVPAGLWEKVRPEEKDDRKGFAWLRNPAAAILVGLLLLIGTLGGYFYFSSQDGTNVTTDTTNVPKNNGGATEGQKENAKVPQSGDQPGTATIRSTDNNEIKTPNQPASGGAETPAAATGNDNRATRDAKVENSPAERRPASLQNGLASSPELMQKNGKTGLGRAGIRPGANNSDPFNTNTARKGNGIDYQLGDRKKGNAGNNDLLSRNKITDEENSFEFIEPYQSNVLTGVTFPSAPVKPGNSFSYTDKQLTAGNHTSKFKNVIICPSNRRTWNTDLFVEAYGSPDFALRSISAVSASPQYLARKDSSSSMQIGYSAGLRLVKPITENILLKAGIQYTQMNEKFVYRTENEIKTTTVVTVRTIVRAPGDTVIISDTSVVQQIGFKNNTVKNRYRSFDIPVTIGYQFGNEDLKIGINAGVIFNISSWYQGVLLDSSMATVPITKANSTIYKTNIGLGIYAGVSIIKRLSDDMHVFAEPYFRYNLSNMTTPQSSYNQKFSLGGISIGLRFNLNRQ